MNVQIQSVHFNADQKLIDHVHKKIQKLQTFHDKIVSVEVYLKLDNVVHQIKDKIAEIRVSAPKQTFFSKFESKTFEESFEFAFDSMVSQIKKHKEKQVGMRVA